MAAERRRKSITILWGILALAAVLLVVVKIENRPPTSVRGPLKILTPPFTANKAELIQELRDRKFQQLDTQLNSYQKAFEGNVLEEGNLAIAFDTFSFTDPALTPILEEWVKNEPSSYPAHLARAEHLLALGWQARGDRFVDKTSEQQFSEMQNLFGESVKEAIAAIKLNPKSSIAYGLIIDAAKGAGSSDGMKRAYAAGIKNVPLSLSIRAYVMTALEPRWGGSYDAMEKFADEAQKHAAQNPRLVSLKGFADADRADEAVSAGDPRKAIRLCNQALEEGGDFYTAYIYRANTYGQLHLYDEALEDLNRANRLRPQNPKVLESLAYVYEGLTRPKDSLAVIEQYRQIAQPDPYLLNIEKWAQNFDSGTAPAVKVGGN
jgi:tetratricopeptide (TPR) repeat protein